MNAYSCAKRTLIPAENGQRFLLKADSKQKREALEKAYVNVNQDEEPMWTKDENLVSWLKKF